MMVLPCIQESEIYFILLTNLQGASFQVPTVFDKQGAQLLAVAFLVVSRTWISDRIASLNGIPHKHKHQPPHPPHPPF